MSNHSSSTHLPDAADKPSGPFVRAVYAAASAPQTLSDIAEQAQTALHTARTNRGMIGDVVRLEVERAVAALGMVTPTEVVELRKRVSDLERHVRSLRADRDTARAQGSAGRSSASATQVPGGPSRAAAPKLGGASAPSTVDSDSDQPERQHTGPDGEATKQKSATAAKRAAAGRPASKRAAKKRAAGDTDSAGESGTQRASVKRSPKPARAAVSASSSANPDIARTVKASDDKESTASGKSAKGTKKKKASPSQRAARKRLTQNTDTDE